MPEFKNIKEVEAELAKHVPIVLEITGKDITLQRMKPLMKKLGNPQSKLKVIHVAGTSGKTSTSYYLAAMLQASVGKVGLTVSPHIDSVTERLQVNSQPVSEKEFCQAFGEFMGLIEGVKPVLSYFELLIALSYWYSHKNNVDYAVVETGLGGLHDATNVAQQADKVCVITDIGIDHTKVLGNKLESIATQKAGIIHKGNRVFMFEQIPVVTDVVRKQAEHMKAELNLLSQRDLEQAFAAENYSDLPGYQRRNWLLARQVYESLKTQSNWKTDTAKLAQSVKLQVPGRMDVRTISDKTLVMDGAHNLQKTAAFVSTFKAQYPGRQAVILLAMKEGKDYPDVLPLLMPICSRLILTTFDVLQDFPAKSIKPSVMSKEAKKLGFEAMEVVEDPAEAVQKLLSAQEDLAVITGSFYLLAVVRPLLPKS